MEKFNIEKIITALIKEELTKSSILFHFPIHPTNFILDFNNEQPF